MMKTTAETIDEIRACFRGKQIPENIALPAEFQA